MKNGQLSYWLSRPELETPATERLEHDEGVDVAIVGAGLSGLWSAWALAKANPSLSIAVFEAEQLGFGASGRNGGWLSAKPVGMRDVLTRQCGRDVVIEFERLLRSAPDEIVSILGAEKIDARHGGYLQVARSPSEQQRIENYLRTSRDWGVDEAQLSLLSARETTARVDLSRTTGALFSPNNYCVDPVKMLFELTRAVQLAGVRIFTHARVDAIAAHKLTIGKTRIDVSRHVIVATEGYSSSQAGQGRRMLPLNGSMLITEPLTDAEWNKIGWGNFEGICGSAHTYFYSQRTPDGRIAIGGRGKPYRFASGLDESGQVDGRTVTALAQMLSELFPQIDVRPSHAWCGVLGVTRDWSPFIENDSANSILRLGGYAGQGLTAAYLAGRTASDLVLNTPSALTSSPWIRTAPRRWEPEPFRWIGANGLYRIYSLADSLEARSSKPRTALIAKAADKIAGR